MAGGVPGGGAADGGGAAPAASAAGSAAWTEPGAGHAGLCRGKSAFVIPSLLLGKPPLHPTACPPDRHTEHETEQLDKVRLDFTSVISAGRLVNDKKCEDGDLFMQDPSNTEYLTKSHPASW